MAVFNKFDIFTEDMASQVHDFSLIGDQLRVALTSGTPLVTDETLLGPPAVAGGTEIAYTNLLGDPTSRDPAIDAGTGQNPAGTWIYILKGVGPDVDLILTASGGSVAAFRYVVHFNLDTVAKVDPLIQWYDHGSTVNLNDGETFTIDYNPATGFFSLT